MARHVRTRLLSTAAAAALTVGMLAGPFAGTAAAFTYPTHYYSSAQMWQCADNAWQDGLTQCAWVQYSDSYRVTATNYSNGLTYYYVTPEWSTAYIWNGSSLGYNQWYGAIGAMHTTVNFYTPDGQWRAGYSESPGRCDNPPDMHNTNDLFLRYCNSTAFGITLRRTTYPFYACYRTYFDSTLMYDNSFGFSVCLWVYL